MPLPPRRGTDREPIPDKRCSKEYLNKPCSAARKTEQTTLPFVLDIIPPTIPFSEGYYNGGKC
jgi:hypothetical protein